MELLAVEYRDAVMKPEDTALAVSRFLGIALDIAAMCAAVDPSLYRNVAE